MRCRLLRNSQLIVLALLVMLPQRPTHAQSLVPPHEVPAIAKQISSHPPKNTLECDEVSSTRLANLGFDLRYHVGFLFRLPMSQMPEGGKLEARIRVSPEKGAPVLLAEYFDIPTVSQALSTLPQPARGPIVASVMGAFVTGPGKYKAELLLISPDNRRFFKQWSFKTEPSSGFVGPMKPNTVDEVVPIRWNGKLNPNGIRLTLMLNATATSASQAKLWDYHFLLTMVKTILEQVPCRSLRIVAFNLDQQVELLRRDNFSLAGWDDLESTLKGVQLSTIDYRALSLNNEREFLTNLVENEISTPSDAVVLVGRRTHFLGKTSRESNPPLLGEAAKLYYLRHDGHEYNRMYADPVDAELIDMTNKYPEMPISKDLAFEINRYRVKPIPDNLTYLVEDLHGSVIPFASSSEFAKSIERLRAELANPPAAHH